MLARQVSQARCRANWALYERLRFHASAVTASEAVATAPAGGAALVDERAAGGQAAADGVVHFAAFTTKTFGAIQVPGGVPLPSFITGARKARREPVALPDALKEVKERARARFDETVELALRLGIDPRRGDQMVRGAALLPGGTGKQLRVAVFATGDAAEAASAAGAEVVGGEELVERLRVGGSSAIDFDKCVAAPDMMPKLSKVARLLGPRGLMPNPKLGTVAEDVAGALRTLRQGRVEFRVDKGGVLHAGVGKVSFDADALAANVGTLVHAVLQLRPKGLKGSGSAGYILAAHLSSTMGPGVPVSMPSLLAAAQSAKR